MRTQSSPVPPLETLRSLLAAQGVFPEDADLEAVLGFLTRVLPAIAEVERRLPPQTRP